MSRVASNLRLLLQVLEQHDGQDQNQQQDDGNGAGQRPVAVDEKLLVQGAADHQRIQPPEQFRDNVLAQRRDEHQQ